jgi:glycine dehydrogenase
MDRSSFLYRHNGPRKHEVSEMLETIGVDSLDQLIFETIPDSIRKKDELKLDPVMTEVQYANHIAELGAKNSVFKNYIGLGYHDTILPAVIQRNIFENPGWYTAYTPYQAEIAQGRLEMLLNFQTMVAELTGMELANASLLDEATAAAEAMIMLFNIRSRAQSKAGVVKFFVDDSCLPQNHALLNTRAVPFGIEIVTGRPSDFDFSSEFFGCILQYPNADGSVENYSEFCKKAAEAEIKVAVAADIMSLVLLTPPGEWGADVVVGTTQRFGIPLGYGGPHAAYFATKEAYKRHIPGRIIGKTKDRNGNEALRMALQTREQHIKRDKATSNICTAQVLLAVMAGAYGAYHGPVGLQEIASRIHNLASTLDAGLKQMGITQENTNYFDTLKVTGLDSSKVKAAAEAQQMNFRIEEDYIGLSISETTSIEDINVILSVFAEATGKETVRMEAAEANIDQGLLRTSDFMTFEVFK